MPIGMRGAMPWSKEEIRSASEAPSTATHLGRKCITYRWRTKRGQGTIGATGGGEFWEPRPGPDDSSAPTGSGEFGLIDLPSILQLVMDILIDEVQELANAGFDNRRGLLGENKKRD